MPAREMNPIASAQTWCCPAGSSSVKPPTLSTGTRCSPRMRHVRESPRAVPTLAFRMGRAWMLSTTVPRSGYSGVGSVRSILLAQQTSTRVSGRTASCVTPLQAGVILKRSRITERVPRAS